MGKDDVTCFKGKEFLMKYHPDDVVCVTFEDITSCRDRQLKDFKKAKPIQCKAWGVIFAYDINYMKLLNLESEGIYDGIIIPSACIVDVKNYVCPDDRR